MDPAKIHTWVCYNRKERRKSLGFASDIIHLMNLGQRYRGSKGVPESLVEDGGLGSLGPPGDLEDSASHNFSTKKSGVGTGDKDKPHLWNQKHNQNLPRTSLDIPQIEI